MMKSYLVVLIVSMVLLGFSQESSALPPFKKAFEEKYTNDAGITDEAKKAEMEEFKKLVKKTGCNICHLKGEEKSEQNDYGKELNKLIDGSAKDRLKAAGAEGKKSMTDTILKELAAAFEKVEKMPADSDGGELFGARIARGKLPFEIPADEDPAGDDPADDDPAVADGAAAEDKPGEPNVGTEPPPTE